MSIYNYTVYKSISMLPVNLYIINENLHFRWNLIFYPHEQNPLILNNTHVRYIYDQRIDC